MSQTSNESSGSSRTINQRPHCKHGSRVLLTSYTENNPGTRFWRCPLWETPSRCEYFVWYEAPYEGQVRKVLLDLIRRQNATAARLKSTVMEHRTSLEHLARNTALLEAQIIKAEEERAEKELLNSTLKETIEALERTRDDHESQIVKTEEISAQKRLVEKRYKQTRLKYGCSVLFNIAIIMFLLFWFAVNSPKPSHFNASTLA